MILIGLGFDDLRLGLDFINVLRTAFTPVVPQSVRTQSSRQYLFTLLGPTSVKAVRRTLMKLTPGVNFTNIFSKAFTREDPQSIKNLVNLSVFVCTFRIYSRKSCTLIVDEIDT
jgi:hypothetical protein